MKPYIALALLPLVLATPAAANEWIQISSSRATIYEARVGSLERTYTTPSGIPIVALTIRARSKTEDRTTFERNYVPVEDCAAGQGTLVTVNMQGRVLYDDDFIFGGGNVSSHIAETICQIAFPEIERAKLKPSKDRVSTNRKKTTPPARTDGAANAQARREVDAFAADPRNSRYEEVRLLMADLIEVADARGEQLGLEQAYAQACEIRDRAIRFQKETPAPAAVRF